MPPSIDHSMNARQTDSALTILTYHSVDESASVLSVSPACFAEHMAWLADAGISVLSLREAVSYRDTTGGWPPRSVVLTFDDGYRSVYQQALPVLSRYGFHATVFLVTAHVDGRNDWESPPPRFGSQPLLTWDEVAALAAAAVEIGSHTRAHSDLRRLSPRHIEEELRGSRRDIEQRVACAVDSFAYPYGHASEDAIAVVRREFRCACTTVLRRATAEPLHVLPRIDAYYLRSPQMLKRLVDGRLDPYVAFRRWGRSVKALLSGS